MTLFEKAQVVGSFIGFSAGGQDHQERFDWVHQQGLVKRALNEILGGDGWRSGTRDGSQWILPTAQARPSSAGQPAPP